MIRISQLKLHVEHTEEELKNKISKLLQVPAEEINDIFIRKQSMDARKKPNLFYVYTVDIVVKNQNAVMKKLRKKRTSEEITLCQPKEYRFPEAGEHSMKYRPVVVGCGPAGLFCAYFLAENGYAPIIIERGAPVEERQKDVEEFWKTGVLKPDSNVQFGEGGAGTFSDGKLNTLVKDPSERIHKSLEVFVEHGAPEDILYVNKPHIGTDILCNVIKSMREKIKENGGTFYFHTQMTEVILDSKQIIAVRLKDSEKEWELPVETLILAPGHSARDTFAMLDKKAIPMEAKSFAVGVRVEHPQELINRSQYGKEYPESLPAAAYKLTAKLSNERGAYSFCMCPGGYVVNASSEMGMLAVNGMSYHARDSKNANSAIIITVTKEDFKGEHPLAGIEFQRALERAAYEAGNGKIPVQRYGEFKQKVTSENVEASADMEINEFFAEHEPCVKGAYEYADLTKIFDENICNSLVEGIESFDRKIHGFAHPRTILLGVESRTSSPVRILRDASFESEIKGLFPCGEGAGYAGGITSAAVDGIKIAEAIRQRYKSFDKEQSV